MEIEYSDALIDVLGRYYESVDAFNDLVGRYREAGIDEFILLYPSTEEQLAIFERIASDAIPKLRG